MFRPKHFDWTDIPALHAFMRAEAFAILVTMDDDGVPQATHLPLMVDPEPAPHGTIIGHVARPNLQHRLFDGRESLAIFHGAHSYISPRWYDNPPANVPTWNYLAVHARGPATVIDDQAVVDAQLDRLTRIHEGSGPEAWRIGMLAQKQHDTLLRGLVMFRMPITMLEGKAKLNQNRTPADRVGVVAALDGGDQAQRAIATAMRDREPAADGE